MSKYFLDSWAWIEYFEGATRGEKVREAITNPRNQIFTHCVSVAEIISKARRTGKDTDVIFEAITSNSNIVEGNVEDSKNVGIVHATIKTTRNRNFSLADAFVLASARKLKAKVITGDPDFKNIDEAVLI